MVFYTFLHFKRRIKKRFPSFLFLRLMMFCIGIQLAAMSPALFWFTLSSLKRASLGNFFILFSCLYSIKDCFCNSWFCFGFIAIVLFRCKNCSASCGTRISHLQRPGNRRKLLTNRQILSGSTSNASKKTKKNSNNKLQSLQPFVHNAAGLAN